MIFLELYHIHSIKNYLVDKKKQNAFTKYYDQKTVSSPMDKEWWHYTLVDEPFLTPTSILISNNKF